MALTPSNMLPLGTLAPDFTLFDTVSNQMLNLDKIKGSDGTVILFICNHCPFVIHINTELVKLANDYKGKGINLIAISSNDIINYPQDGPDFMKIHAKENAYSFPYLYDETQEVAKKYDAACTPDLYVFNAELKLTYRGQLDASRPGNGIPLTGEDIRSALDNQLNNHISDTQQKPSMGCGIKWKS